MVILSHNYVDKQIDHEVNILFEMKLNARIPQRREDASMFTKPQAVGSGPFCASAHFVTGLMQALVDFIEYFKEQEE